MPDDTQPGTRARYGAPDVTAAPRTPAQPCAPGDADAAAVARLAAGIDTSTTLGVSGFGEGRRRDVARTVDAALEVLRSSNARRLADEADAALASLAEATWDDGARRGADDDGGRGADAPERDGLLARLARTFRRPGTRYSPAGREPAGGAGGEARGATSGHAGATGSAGAAGTDGALAPELVDRAEVALKLRQAALLKDQSVLDALLRDLAGQSHDLASLAAAARLRATSTPGRSGDLAARADQLTASRLLAEQAAAALTLVRHADASMTDALGEVVEAALPIWRKLAGSSVQASGQEAATGAEPAGTEPTGTEPAGTEPTARVRLAGPPEELSFSLRRLEDARRESRAAGEEAARTLSAVRPMA